MRSATPHKENFLKYNKKEFQSLSDWNSFFNHFLAQFLWGHFPAFI